MNERLHAWADAPAHQSDFQLRNLHHDAGFLSSSGTAELVMRSRCSEDDVAQAGTVVQVVYQVSHLPSFGGINSFGWKLKPQGEAAAAFKVQSVSTRDVTLEGLSIESSTREKDGRLDSVLRNHLDRLQAGKQEVKHLAFDVGMRGLHAESVEKLTQLFSQSCGVQRMTQAERQLMRDALKTLLSQGMSLQIDKLKGESANGALDGGFTLALKPAQQSGSIQLAELITSSGRLQFKGDLASPELRQMAGALGWARVNQDGIESSFHYEKGQLKVLDRLTDASAVQGMLAIADTVILALLEDRIPPVMAAKQESPEPDGEQEVEAEAEEVMRLEPAPEGAETEAAPAQEAP